MLKIKIAVYSLINKVLQKYPYKIFNSERSIDYLISNKISLCRFGEGEMNLIAHNQDLKFQKYDPILAQRMKQILKSNNDKVAIAIPYAIKDYSHMNERAKNFWKENLSYSAIDWYRNILRSKRYLDSLMTRCYIDLEDKSNTRRLYDKWQSIWEGKDIIVIEGESSRLGVGNDLFARCKSIRRVLCPAENAFSHYNRILQYLLTLPREPIYLIALGPTASVLAYDLAINGYFALDVGHIDIEYEWFMLGADKPVKIIGKYTNETKGGNEVSKITDKKYEGEILTSILQNYEQQS